MDNANKVRELQTFKRINKHILYTLKKIGYEWFEENKC